MNSRINQNIKEKKGKNLEEVSQPHFGLNVRMKLTFPKVGTWSPPGLSKTQSSITGGQNTSHLGCFLYQWKGLEV
jgi:hypothetical protein